MSLEADVASLARATPFGLLPHEALRLIAFASERRDLKAGQTLFRAGDPGDAAYLILDGEILLNARGAEKIAGRGVLIGETALLIDVERIATAQVLNDASLLLRAARSVPPGARRISRRGRQDAGAGRRAHPRADRFPRNFAHGKIRALSGRAGGRQT